MYFIIKVVKWKKGRQEDMKCEGRQIGERPKLIWLSRRSHYIKVFSVFYQPSCPKPFLALIFSLLLLLNPDKIKVTRYFWNLFSSEQNSIQLLLVMCAVIIVASTIEFESNFDECLQMSNFTIHLAFLFRKYIWRRKKHFGLVFQEKGI